MTVTERESWGSSESGTGCTDCAGGATCIACTRAGFAPAKLDDSKTDDEGGQLQQTDAGFIQRRFRGELKTNPKQTQNKPKTNPKQTQNKPKTKMGRNTVHVRKELAPQRIDGGQHNLPDLTGLAAVELIHVHFQRLSKLGTALIQLRHRLVHQVHLRAVDWGSTHTRTKQKFNHQQRPRLKPL
jgi:hypothetical protein